MKPIIQLHNVWKTHQMGVVQVHALKGVTLQVRKGEFLAIVGPSGSGKSTMISLVGCLDLPSRGRIVLEGKNIAHLSENELAHMRGRTIGFIFQQFNLMPTLSALENVMLPMMFQEVRTNERMARAEKLLKQVGLAERIHHRPSELSGGEQQRVAIARSLANNPTVILADEPTGNLDSKIGKEIMSLLVDLHKQGKTIVMVTHDLDLVPHGDRVVHLKDGMIEKEVVLREKNSV